LPSNYLQDEVPGQQALGDPGRAVLVQALHVDPAEVPPADLHAQLRLGPLQPDQPGGRGGVAGAGMPSHGTITQSQKRNALANTWHGIGSGKFGCLQLSKL